jgi:hypothetical protein
LILGGVSVSWQSGVRVFETLLRQRGVDPDAVADVDSAWAAFEEFLQIPLDGLLTDEDSDSDGFIVQWGRWSWNDGLPSLVFTRQLAIPDGEDPHWQPSYWRVELEMTFPNDRGLAGLDELNESNTGFSFEPVGPARSAEIAATREHYLTIYPLLRTLFNATPTTSRLALEQVC